MRETVIQLFPDTNLFIQCTDLKALDWSAVGSYDQIELVVSRPVQKEIDRQKGGGNSRLSRRARTAASTLRAIVTNGLKPIVIREASPRVTIALDMQLRPDPSLQNTLNYDEADDVLVGIAHAMACSQPDKNIAILTHDTGVMASAASTNTQYICIPESWILGPEDTKAEKDLRTAQAEIARLRSSEPEFYFKCIDASGNSIEEIILECPKIDALTEAEITDLMELARRRFPKKTDFARRSEVPGQTDSIALSLALIAGLGSPPSQSQIDKYHRLYVDWETSLSKYLKNIHQSFAHEKSRLECRFVAQNIGSRPANDVLVELRANGDFMIFRPNKQNNGDQGEDGNPPSPPAPPMSFVPDFLQIVMGMQRHRALPDYLDMPSRLHTHLQRDDPEKFYYKQSPENGSALRLSCALWRHTSNSEDFTGEIHLLDHVDTRGSIELLIHASNLGTSCKLVVPVSIRIVSFSTYQSAKQMVCELQMQNESD